MGRHKWLKFMVVNLENLRQRFKFGGSEVTRKVAGRLQEIIDELGPELPEELPELLGGVNNNIYRHPSFDYNFGNKTIVMKDGRTVELTGMEIAVLERLLKAPNQVLSGRDLKASGMSDKDFWKHIAHLRRDIEPDPRRPQIIITVRGSGYYLVDSSKKLSANLDSLQQTPVGLDSPEGLRNPGKPRFYHHRLFTYDYGRKCVVVGGQTVQLTLREIFILEFLLGHPNELLTVPAILENAFGRNYSSGMVKTYVRYLRRKIEPDPASPQILITKRNQGYYLADCDRVSEEVDVLMELNNEEVFQHSDGWKFNLSRGSLTVNGKSVDLTSTERKLLEKFVHNLNRVLTKETLIQFAWGNPVDAGDDDLKLYVHRLLFKIQPDRGKGQPGCIRAVKGLGYCLVDSDRLSESGNEWLEGV